MQTSCAPDTLITSQYAGGGMHRMTDRGRADLLADLHRELLEQEAQLKNLMDQLLARERLREPSASTAWQDPAVSPGDQIRLTRREVQILQLLVRGYTNRQIGAQLQLGAGTVRNRLSRIFSKLGVMTRTHAAVRAVELRLCTPGPAEETRCV
jgi:DNA-binding NarL/FixJ family response regulator